MFSSRLRGLCCDARHRLAGLIKSRSGRDFVLTVGIIVADIVEIVLLTIEPAPFLLNQSVQARLRIGSDDSLPGSREITDERRVASAEVVENPALAGV